MTAAERHHIGQRVKVGAIGLAIVVLLIVVAGAILNAVTRERPVAAGASSPEIAANQLAANDAAASEPLAAMGVTPTTGNATAAK